RRRDRDLSRGRDPGDLCRRPARAGEPAGRAVRARRGMMRAALIALGLAALAGAPYVVDTYYLTLLVPFFGYAIEMLGLNLLFGYTGVLSFGHALFIAIGAYVTAALTSKFHVRSYEVILLAALASGLIVALPVGAICIRYQKIFFGMLTLAF